MNLKSRILAVSPYCSLFLVLCGMSFGLAFSDDKGQQQPDGNGNGNFVIGPDYKIDPELTDKGNPKGRSFEFSMRLADSKVFRGDDSTLDPKKPVRTERKIFVYVPAVTATL